MPSVTPKAAKYSNKKASLPFQFNGYSFYSLQEEKFPLLFECCKTASKHFISIRVFFSRVKRKPLKFLWLGGKCGRGLSACRLPTAGCRLSRAAKTKKAQKSERFYFLLMAFRC